MDTLEAALKLVTKCQFAIFPLHTVEDGRCSCGRDCGRDAGKHPIASLAPNGFKNATTNPDQVRQWWALFPDANIGVATGDVSGIIVMDIDPKHGGTLSLNNLENTHGSIPDTWVSHTGGAGMHVFFNAIDGIRNRVGMVPGIDIRSDGGYIVAPPSTHLSGMQYVWDENLRPSASFQRPADAPDWLVKLMGGRMDRGGSSPLPEKITEGGRNDLLASAGGVMRRKNFSSQAVEAALLIENRLRCEPPLDDDEVRRIAWSINRYPAAAVPQVMAGGRRLH